MEIKQTLFGAQARPYADHVWCWNIYTDKPREEVLEYCKSHFETAKLEQKDYIDKYRSSKSFEETMGIVCGGYYSLVKIDGGYQYKVVKEYID